ncbi:acyl-CoA dehydrogenase family protein [Pararhodobacter oceanensis]|uniref:acyl-CoA dehydrogenase family protein n=1 Tax=Pararhodobacter oceanensis TaxID=2172121 RepID=UPI003A94B19F
MSAATRLEAGARGPAFLRADSDAGFRAGLKSWLAAELPALAGVRGPAEANSIAFRLAWESHCCRAGLSGLGWPLAEGGHALSLARQAIYHEECARAGTPLPVNMIGHGIVAPTLLAFGDAAQKARFLPRILDNSEVWCQGYSEPGAGSDLAALRLSARRDGEEYVLNGQKIWTSFADLSQWCLLLARTDASATRHAGISVLLVDMSLQGVTCRPIRQITGEADFNEVFFDNVRVPASARLGPENGGWRLAMAAANFERSTYFVPRVVRMQAELEALIRLAAERRQADGCAMLEVPGIRAAITDLGLKTHAMRLMAEDILVEAERGQTSGVSSSTLKLLWSENHQRLFDVAMEVLGPEAALGPQEVSGAAQGRWARDYLWTRAETILAGTSEVHRNIIAERGLGLPK